MKENNPGCNCCAEPTPPIAYRATVIFGGGPFVVSSSWQATVWRETGNQGIGRLWQVIGLDNVASGFGQQPCDGFTINRSEITLDDPSATGQIGLTPTTRIEVAKTAGPLDTFPAALPVAFGEEEVALFGYTRACDGNQEAGSAYTVTLFDVTGSAGQELDGVPIPVEPAGASGAGTDNDSHYRNAGTLTKSCDQPGDPWPDTIQATVAGVVQGAQPGTRCAEYNRTLAMSRRPWWGEANTLNGNAANLGYEGKLSLGDGWWITFWWLWEFAGPLYLGASACFVDGAGEIPDWIGAVWQKSVNTTIDCSGDRGAVFSAGPTEFSKTVSSGTAPADAFRCDFSAATFTSLF